MLSKQDEKIRSIVGRYPEFWNTTSAYMSSLRSGIRSGLWNKHKVKLLKIRNCREQIPNPNPKGVKPTVWGGRCELCRKLHLTKDLQVDHIRTDVSSLKCFNDIPKFIEDMILVTEDDLRIVCKPCHLVVSYSQRMGITFDEAKVEKGVIDLVKRKADKAYLQSNNLPVDKTQAARRARIVSHKLGLLADVRLHSKIK